MRRKKIKLLSFTKRDIRFRVSFLAVSFTKAFACERYIARLAVVDRCIRQLARFYVSLCVRLIVFYISFIFFLFINIAYMVTVRRRTIENDWWKNVGYVVLNVWGCAAYVVMIRCLAIRRLSAWYLALDISPLNVTAQSSIQQRRAFSFSRDFEVIDFWKLDANCAMEFAFEKWFLVFLMSCRRRKLNLQLFQFLNSGFTFYP